MQININKPIATNLLTGIITDTSSFKNSNTNSQSLEIASKLLDFGADLNLINSSIYNDRSIKRISLEKKILSNFLFDNDSKSGFSYCTLEDYRNTNTTKEDSEGMANYFLHHKEIMIGIFVREIDKKSWKVSLRSNGYIDLSKLANMFGGGGHKNAAGFKYSGEIEDLRKDLNKVASSILRSESCKDAIRRDKLIITCGCLLPLRQIVFEQVHFLCEIPDQV